MLANAVLNSNFRTYMLPIIFPFYFPCYIHGLECTISMNNGLSFNSHKSQSIKVVFPHKWHDHVFHIAEGQDMNTTEVTKWKSSGILHKLVYVRPQKSAPVSRSFTIN